MTKSADNKNLVIKKETIKGSDQVKRSLKYSIADGSLYSAMTGFGESFFSAFAVFLKATSMQIGILGSLPQTLGAISQFWSDKLIQTFKSRKNFVCFFAFLQGLMYIPAMFAFFMGAFNVFYFIFFVCFYFIFGSLISPAWNSWMGDLVDVNTRGAYFGFRNRITGIVSFISFLTAGYLLQLFTNGTMQYLGFALLFSIAFGSRMISVLFLSKKYEPPFKIEREPQFDFREFIKLAWYRNYGTFVLYMACMNFAVFLASPFIAAYLLYDLKLNYITFTIVIGTPIIVKFLMMPVWGRLCDRYGTRKVLVLTGLAMPFASLLWLFSTDIWYLILIRVFDGFVWAGFDMAVFGFLFDSTNSSNRSTYIAYNNILNGIALLFGSIIGGLIVTFNTVYWSKYLLVFVLSFITRILISLIFLPKIQEARKGLEKISYPKLFLKTMTTMNPHEIKYGLITFRSKLRRKKKFKNVAHDRM